MWTNNGKHWFQYTPSHRLASPAAECTVLWASEGFLRFPPQGEQRAGTPTPALATCTDSSVERDNGDFSTHDVNKMITKWATFKQKEFYETMYVSKNTYFVNLLYKHLLKIEKTNKKKQHDFEFKFKISQCSKQVRVNVYGKKDRNSTRQKKRYRIKKRPTYLRDCYYVVCIRRQVIFAFPTDFLECRDGGNREVWISQSLKHQRQNTAEHHWVIGQPFSQSAWWENQSSTVLYLLRNCSKTWSKREDINFIKNVLRNAYCHEFTTT